MHGDLNPGNLLAAGGGRWLAIDPKPMRGDPAYDLWPLLEQVDDPFEHPDPAAVLRERVALLAGLLDLDARPGRGLGVRALHRVRPVGLGPSSATSPARERSSAQAAVWARRGRLIRSTRCPGACTCSNTRLVCVWATSGRVLRCSSTNARSSGESRTATCTSTSSTPASRYTSRTSGRCASRCATSVRRARADGWSRTAIIACSPRPTASGSTWAWKPRSTPDSRSARTRAWHVDGAIPASAASSLLEIRPSRSSSLSRRRSTSSSSTAPNAVRRGPAERRFDESATDMQRI